MLKKIKKKIKVLKNNYNYAKHIIDYYNNNRIAFEYDLPAEFIITDHAHKQMDSRFKWDNNTKQKVIIKAWNSEEKMSQQFFASKKKLGYDKCKYRKFSGYIFVFATKYNKQLGRSQKILITAINPKLIEKSYNPKLRTKK